MVNITFKGIVSIFLKKSCFTAICCLPLVRNIKIIAAGIIIGTSSKKCDYPIE